MSSYFEGSESWLWAYNNDDITHRGVKSFPFHHITVRYVRTYSRDYF